MCKKNIKEIIANKKTKIVSTEEALKDVDPFFTDRELNKFRNKK